MQTGTNRLKRTCKLMGGIVLVMLSLSAQAALVGEWNFEEGSGATALDTSTNSHDGVIINGASYVQGVDGPGTFGLEIVKANDHRVAIPGASWDTITNAFSIALWCFGAPSQPVNNSIFSVRNPARYINSHCPWGDGSVYFDVARAGNNGRIITNLSSDPSQFRDGWNFYVFTVDIAAGNAQRVFLNTNEIGFVTSSPATNISGVTQFILGSEGENNNVYDGIIDNVQLYDHALTTNEIAALFQSVTPQFAGPVINASVTEGIIPLDVVFTGTNSTASGNILAYEWDFGDGNTNSGGVVTNTYTESRMFTPSLTIRTDEGLTESATVDLLVKLPPMVPASLVTTSLATNSPPVFSTNDLAQTAYGSSFAVSPQNHTVLTRHPELFNGAIGNPANYNDQNAPGLVRMEQGNSVTLMFDPAVAPRGVDLYGLSTIFGWQVFVDANFPERNLSRSNQGYEVLAIYANGAVAELIPSMHWEPNNDTSSSPQDAYWTQVSFTNATSEALATGIAGLQWNITFPANAAAFSVNHLTAREWDVFGTPTAFPVSEVAANGNDLVLGWEAITNKVYDLEMTTNNLARAPITWVPVPGLTNLTDVVGPIAVTATVDAVERAMFRIRETSAP